jgi:hypothetical protein
MGSRRQVFPRSVIVVCLTVLALEAIVLVSQLGRDPAPHGLRLAIAAPGVVAQGLADQANALPGRPFRAQVLAQVDPAATTRAARGAVRNGSSFAAVALDLRAGTDTLFVSTVADADLNRVVRARVAATENSYGRGLTVIAVAPSRNPGVGRSAAYLLTALWVVAGFVCTAVLTLVRGPVARTFRLAAARVVGLAGASAVLSALIAVLARLVVDVNLPLLWVLGTAAMLASAWTTLALESLARLAGLGLATTLFVLLAGPLFALNDPQLQPWPWSLVTPWTLHGAVLELANHLVHFDAAPVLRVMLVLAAWIGLPLLTAAVARRERLRASDVEPLVADHSK